MKVPCTLPGRVYLVGAGPGSARLLTLRALELLQTVDIVMHDDLISEEILEQISPRVAVHSVGKRCGPKKITQEEINLRLVTAARAGRSVVRLKSGDPMIFGRAQEEIRALRVAGIRFEIVPGITAASAAAAAALVPLTDRRTASKLVLVSNHAEMGKTHRTWHQAASADATLVFYMPGSDFAELLAELRGRGVDGDTPCLLASRVSQKGQRIVKTTVRRLSEAPKMASPSLLIVGDAVAEASAVEEFGAAVSPPGKIEAILKLESAHQQIAVD